jgi:hypothetical protein
MSLGAHQICHQSFGHPFLSKQVVRMCYAKVAAKSLPVVLTDPVTGPSFPHLVMGYGCIKHVLDGTFLRSPRRLWCICGTLPFFGGNRYSPLRLVHFLQSLFKGVMRLPCKIIGSWSWSEPLDHSFNDDVILDYRILSLKLEKPSDK